MAAAAVATRLAYLSDTYLLKGSGKVVEIIRDGIVSPHGPHRMILDETLFYPQGGGQPADQGTCHEDPDSTDGQVFQVKHVVLDGATGQVHHFGQASELLSEGQTVFFRVDGDRRLRNARLHTAGHLLDAVVQKLGYPIVGKKGYHYEDGPFVEFDGVLESTGAETIKAINDELKRVINDVDSTVESRMLEGDEAEAVDAPQGKLPRVVTIKGLKGSPCGGTHVSHVQELGEVIVTKIRCKKGTTNMKYVVRASTNEPTSG